MTVVRFLSLVLILGASATFLGSPASLGDQKANSSCWNVTLDKLKAEHKVRIKVKAPLFFGRASALGYDNGIESETPSSGTCTAYIRRAENDTSDIQVEPGDWKNYMGGGVDKNGREWLAAMDSGTLIYGFSCDRFARNSSRLGDLSWAFKDQIEVDCSETGNVKYVQN
jgi:hypothetical protein